MEFDTKIKIILRNVLKKASQRKMAVSIYTEELFSTYNDEDNRAEVRKHKIVWA